MIFMYIYKFYDHGMIIYVNDYLWLLMIIYLLVMIIFHYKMIINDYFYYNILV